MQPLRIDVWSDIACPWCYVGKRRLEAALAQFPHPVELVWRSFELDPRAPKVLDAAVSTAARLARKYGTSVPEAEAMLDRMTATAAADGLELRFDRLRSGNTLDAHRLLHLARAEGKQDALKERLFRAYFSEGAALNEPGVLARLAGEVGLDPARVEQVLASDELTAEVRADEAEAQAIGVRGVPFFVLAGSHAVSGAHPAASLRAALQAAWVARGGRDENEVDEAGACGPGGCA